jgi:hypothetical protein
MKTVVLAVLPLLAVASIVAGAPAEKSGIESGDKPVASTVSGDTLVGFIVSGDTTEGGKSRYGVETCILVIVEKR